MTKRQRTLLFFTLSGLFLILVPIFVLYSQGYRIDWSQGRIAQTGAFYLKAEPPRAEILIDGVPHKRTDFLFGSALTKNLFPGSYALELVKEGYHSWQKVLDIREREVTEAKNILLFKTNAAFTSLSDSVERYWISPDGQYALLERKDGAASWELALLNLRTGTQEILAAQETAGEEIAGIRWAENSQRFLLEKSRGFSPILEIRSVLRG
ncbi:MAG: hypothetical protein Q8P12_07125, partial [bacterium]|nr:hypothetical protein [bacterium]